MNSLLVLVRRGRVGTQDGGERRSVSSRGCTLSMRNRKYVQANDAGPTLPHVFPGDRHSHIKVVRARITATRLLEPKTYSSFIHRLILKNHLVFTKKWILAAEITKSRKKSLKISDLIDI